MARAAVTGRASSRRLRPAAPHGRASRADELLLVKEGLPVEAAAAEWAGRISRATVVQARRDNAVAFGGTLEDQTAVTLGLKQIGSPDAPFQPNRPFDRTTGQGYVAARDGDYSVSEPNRGIEFMLTA